MKRLLGLILFADGIASSIGGQGFLYWLRMMLPSRFHPILDTFLKWPEPLLRWAALLQAILGVLLITGPRNRAREQTIHVEMPDAAQAPSPEPAPESAR